MNYRIAGIITVTVMLLIAVTDYVIVTNAEAKETAELELQAAHEIELQEAQEAAAALRVRQVKELYLTNLKLGNPEVLTETEVRRLQNKQLTLLNVIHGSQEPVVDKLDELAKAIATHEGFYIPGTLPARYHNPGAMMAASYCEYTSTGHHNFMKFETDEQGFECLKKGLIRYRDRGASIASLIQAWAPHSDNNKPTEYANIVANKLGVHPDTPLSELF